MCKGFRSLPSRWFLAWATLLVMANAGSGKLTADDAIVWRTGTELRLHLQNKVTVTWSGSSSTLRDVLASISQRERLAIFLDRRVDPNQPVVLTARDETWINVLKGLAERLQLGICLVDDVTYLGPKHAAANLATLPSVRTQELRNLPAAAARRFVNTQAWQWQQLATPRELIQQLADGEAINVQGLEQIPHDLMAANDLPPLSLVKRLSLMLAGFDLTFEYAASDGSALRLVPLPDPTSQQRTFAVGTTAQSKAVQLAAQFPNAKIRVEGSNIIAAGTAEELFDIDRWLQGTRVRRTTGPPITTFTLKADGNRIVDLLGAVAKQLQVELKFNSMIEDKLQKRMTIDVKDATLDHLLEAILDPVGLSFRVDEQQLVIE